ncbi:PTS lactose/cellobiose transporter subunit IIA (plasmid) [Fusobacterium sp. SB021]|uniref:PTS lactose/cellobiose transporter subunit IIA n=1 Tax=Fusobacterium sp. SB021 TaxID=2744227 RepID=UPI003CF802CE
MQKEASGESIPVSMLFIHAQDHIMTAISEKELIKKMILQNKKINELENRIFN